MSRIGDDNSDNQRIREMQESELRNRTDREKTDREKTTKSFQDVMRDKNSRTSAAVQQNARQQQQQQNGKKPAAKEQQSLADAVLKRHIPKTGAELARRAALSKAMEGSLQKTRSSDAEKARTAETERSDDLVKRSDDERERIEHDVREGETRDTRRTEEAEAQFRKVDPDGERRDRTAGDRDKKGGQGRESDGREGKSERVAGAEGAKGAAGAKTIPPEVIDAIVNGIQSGLAADGRTELHIDLKGDMLEGVRLSVRNENGKIHCTFSNCEKDLKNLLESSKGALMRGLSKRGMTLASLKVT